MTYRLTPSRGQLSEEEEKNPGINNPFTSICLIQNNNEKIIKIQFEDNFGCLYLLLSPRFVFWQSYDLNY